MTTPTVGEMLLELFDSPVGGSRDAYLVRQAARRGAARAGDEVPPVQTKPTRIESARAALENVLWLWEMGTPIREIADRYHPDGEPRPLSTFAKYAYSHGLTEIGRAASEALTLERKLS